ncbi:hypothetical protein HNW77_09560 [Komagataeibacter sp. AV436]|uniref:Uncharacterized protein n=1 Tax=Komagataeibacter melomenusus TaxID=2766578 RepID=A0ABX2AFQ7_9PROT|nr:hypothetical protein [Komagataeibacter melomenusus]MBV1831087.1 hypothetical protein [Komagataeibacter melomenusus]NPC66636.1 hypothetical protein [Komagataeibacter melomenusus]
MVDMKFNCEIKMTGSEKEAFCRMVDLMKEAGFSLFDHNGIIISLVFDGGHNGAIWNVPGNEIPDYFQRDLDCLHKGSIDDFYRDIENGCLKNVQFWREPGHNLFVTWQVKENYVLYMIGLDGWKKEQAIQIISGMVRFILEFYKDARDLDTVFSLSTE